MRVRQNLEVFMKEHGATALTCAGAAGVVATSVLTAKATTKLDYILAEAEKEKGNELTTFEKVNYALPVYLPAILMGTATVSCIFGANAINKKHQAYLLSSYAFLNETFKDYRKTVNELYGEDADDAVEEAMYNNKPRRD